MTVRKEFHSGKHTKTDDWMDEHPTMTYAVAIAIIVGILGLIIAGVMFVFHS
jgi:hypothetical protein